MGCFLKEILVGPNFCKVAFDVTMKFDSLLLLLPLLTAGFIKFWFLRPVCYY